MKQSGGRKVRRVKWENTSALAESIRGVATIRGGQAKREGGLGRAVLEGRF